MSDVSHECMVCGKRSDAQFDVVKCELDHTLDRWLPWRNES